MSKVIQTGLVKTVPIKDPIIILDNRNFIVDGHIRRIWGKGKSPDTYHLNHEMTIETHISKINKLVIEFGHKDYFGDEPTISQIDIVESDFHEAFENLNKEVQFSIIEDRENPGSTKGIGKLTNPVKEELLQFITGERKPKFLTVREKAMVEKFLEFHLSKQ